MEVSERIIKILNHLNKKAGDFALAIGVTPATVSNLRTGKTGISFQIAQKICSTYQDFSFDWVMYGKGEMLKSNYNQVNTLDIGQSNPYTGQLFTFDGVSAEKNERKNGIDDAIDGMPTASENGSDDQELDSSPKTAVNTKKTLVENLTSSKDSLDKNNKVIGESTVANRSIEKIIIYYSDKTFEEFDLTKCKL